MRCEERKKVKPAKSEIRNYTVNFLVYADE